MVPDKANCSIFYTCDEDGNFVADVCQLGNHFNETLPNTIKQNNEKPTMILKHIRKELFLPLLYYIYSDECEVKKKLFIYLN